MKILVCGGREYTDHETVFRNLDYIKPTSVIHGTLNEVDEATTKWCIEKRVKRYPNHTDDIGAHPDLKLLVAFGSDEASEELIVEAQSRNIKIMRVKE